MAPIDEFQQPSLEGEQNADALTLDTAETGTDLALVDNDSKDDELSNALRESRKAVPADPRLNVEKPLGKYALDYSLHGKHIRETHATIPHALARIAALGRLNIVPATSTL